MGAVIAITVDTSALQNAFERLSKEAQDLRPAFENIGIKLAENTQERFTSNVAPDGRAWKPSERARREGGRTLLDHGHLRDSITYVATNDQVEIGTNVVYAAIHQFGGKTSSHKIAAKRVKALSFNGRFAKSVNHPGSDMPPRPFLGLSAEDERDVMGILDGHLRLALP